MPVANLSSLQLVDAVSAFLESNVLPDTEGRMTFDVRVAIRVLGVVKRELSEADTLDSQEVSRLSALLGKTDSLQALNDELAERIAKGDVTAATSGLTEHLYQTALAKLSIDNPKFSTYDRLASRCRETE